MPDMNPSSSIRPLRLAVLISGGGRTLLNLHQHILDGSLHARIDIVISSRRDAQGLERAKQQNLPTIVVDRTSLPPDAFQDALTAAVDSVDLVCMAGFLSLWRIPDTFTGRVINIHPALLPDFGGKGMYGLHVHEAVLNSGARESGCTVHVCDNVYDHGPILLQRRVPVLPGDTPMSLAARVFAEECIAYPDAVNLLASRRIGSDHSDHETG